MAASATSPLPPDWPDLRPRERCSVTGEVILPGSSYVAALVAPDDGPLQRISISQVAYDAFKQPQLVARWHAVMPDNTAGQRKARRRGLAETLSNVLQSQTGGERGERLRFFAGMFLLRRRLARVVDRNDATWTLELTSSGETVSVVEPDERSADDDADFAKLLESAA